MRVSAATAQESCFLVVAVAPTAAVACSVPVRRRTHRLVAVAEAVELCLSPTRQKRCFSAAGAAVAACSGQDLQTGHLLVEVAVGYFDPDQQIDSRSAAEAVFAVLLSRTGLQLVEAVGYSLLGLQRGHLNVAAEMCLYSY